MKIRVFIFSCKGHEAKAAALEKKIAPLAPVAVINSEEGSKRPVRGGCISMMVYSSEQWSKALEPARADLIFHIQADVSCERFDPLFAAAESMWRGYRLGIWEVGLPVLVH